MPEVVFDARPWRSSLSGSGGAVLEKRATVIVVMPPVSSYAMSRNSTRR